MEPVILRGLLPRGSKYPILEVSGSKSHALIGFGDQRRSILGPSGLEILTAAHMSEAVAATRELPRLCRKMLQLTMMFQVIRPKHLCADAHVYMYIYIYVYA